MSVERRRRFWSVLGLVLAAGCAGSPVKPQASDWSRRQLEGVSLEAPYGFTGNENPLPGYVNIASYKPEIERPALDIRVDVLQAPIGMTPPTLEEFAKAVFSLETKADGAFQSEEARPVKVDDVDGRRSRAVGRRGVVVEGLVFQKGAYFWLIEVYFDDQSLSADAQRVLDSVQID